MSRYFDRDFFRFLFGFMLIILVSLAVVLIAKAYQSEQKIKSIPEDSIINIAKTKP
ncbi:MAG: hypothetical protein HY507_02215 [Candidatus Zambryskibacteria bacterium]|nr:hypothetical protein [Candidatus Zambryskibacteria bacterium]